MMFSVALLIIASMFLITTSQELPDYNYLLQQYVAVCGIQLCNISFAILPFVHKNISDLPSMCPPCRCDDCILYVDCCPDIEIHFLKFRCESDLVYSPVDIGSDFYFSVLDSCPEKSDEKLVQLCENRTDLIDNLSLNPVTSLSGITYRNVYCAQCNGEKDYQTWSLDIKCNEFVDFNFLSSFEEIENVIIEKKCVVKYNHLSVSFKIKRCELPNNDLIGRCNMTGSWTSYDKDIELACNAFNSPVDAYKNIFCFLCNPPMTEKDKLITKCNETGNLIEISEAFQNGCLLYNESSATYPFKNLFCYYCNKEEETYEYTDIAGKCITSVENNDELSYKIIDGVFTNDFILKYVGDVDVKQAPNHRLNTSFVFYDGEREVNMLNLLNYYESAYGPKTCGIYSSTQIKPPYECECYPPCLSAGTCCIDFELDNRWMCSNDLVMSNTCRYSNKNFNQKCYRRGEMRYDMPVHVDLTKQHYANLYCALCGDELLNSITPSGKNLRPWNIKITCPIGKPLAVYYQLSVSDIIELGKERSCVVAYEPKKDDIIPCDDTERTINSCNITGKWIEADEDVRWACERLHPIYLTSPMGFRNVFCILCNPGIHMEPLHTTTTIIDVTSTAIPPTCLICLTDNKNIMFRTLFQLSYEEDESISQCRNGQFLDTLQNKCRNVTCSPGYILGNSSCEPLLLSTSNLGYIIAVRLETVSPINPVENRYFLQDIEFSMRDFLYWYLELKIFPQFASVFMVSNASCNTNIATQMKILASVEFYINENVLRMDVETKLVNLQNESFATGVGAAFTGYIMNLDNNAINARTIINNRAQFTGNCYFSRSEIQRSDQFYRFNPVSKLLLCKQVILEDGEIRIDSTASVVTFKSNGIKLKQGNFMFDNDGTIRVCIDTLKSLTKHSQPADLVLQTVNLVAMGLSTVCLFLTFLTYSMFPVLRSIPGKNNMSLVVSYFFLQSVLVIGTKINESDVSCKIFGILLHYFLLTSFTCLSVCTVHMFRAFRSIHLPHSAEHDNRTFLYYTLYAYCSPILVIGTNISATLSLSGDLGYANRGTFCFITNRYVTLASVIVPVSLICVCNAVFFVMTMHQIRSTPKIERSGSHASIRRNSVVYIKLFSLTGVTWGIQIIDAFLPVTYLSIIASLCNSLQGVYIFISYICNVRVLNMYRKLLRCYNKESESSTSKPTINFSSDVSMRCNNS